MNQELVKYVIGKHKNSGPIVAYVDEDEIMRGPFSKASKRLENIEARADILTRWKTPCILTPKEYEEFDMPKSTNQIMVIFENILGYVPKYKGYYDKKNDLDWKVSTDKSISKLSELGLEDLKDVVTKDLLTALVHLFILSTGRISAASVMLLTTEEDGQSYDDLFISHYDESISNNKANNLDNIREFYLMARSSNQLMFKTLKPFYSDVADELDELDTSFIRKKSENLYKVIEYNRKLAQQLLRASVDLEQAPSNVNPQIFISKYYLNNSKEKSTSTSPSLKTTRSFAKNAGTTDHGYTVAAVKEVLARFIRLGDLTNALKCVFELYAFIEDGNEAMAIVNGMYNSLVAIAADNVSPGQLGLIAFVAEKVINYVHRSSEFGHDNSYSAYIPYILVVMLVEAKKSRLATQLYSLYSEPTMMAEQGIQAADIDTLPDAVWDDYEDKKCPVLRKGDYLVNNGDIALGIIACMYYLDRKDEQAFLWLDFLLEKVKKTKVVVYDGKTKADILIWKMLEPYIPDPRIYENLLDAYFKGMPKKLSILTSIVAFILLNKVEDSDITSFEQAKADYDEIMDEIDADELQRYVDGKFTLNIDEMIMQKKVANKKRRSEADIDNNKMLEELENVDTDYEDAELAENYYRLV